MKTEAELRKMLRNYERIHKLVTAKYLATDISAPSYDKWVTLMLMSAIQISTVLEILGEDSSVYTELIESVFQN